MKEMRSANLSGPLKGLRPYHALLGLTQASGFAGGFDFVDLEGPVQMRPPSAF